MKYFTNCNTLDELKKEYRRLVMIHHPDNGGDAATMQAINGMYAESFMNFVSFQYSDYCVAFYVSEESSVMIYDEIHDDAILTIPVETEADANSVMHHWWMNRPRGCICHVI